MITRKIDYAVSSGAVIGNPERVAAVHATGLLDTPAEVAFDQYARLAKRLLHAAAAFVTIIDDKRVFFKSAIASVELQGTLPRDVPIADSYCPYTVSAGSAFTVSDTRIDLRFEGLSTADGFNLIAYAGVPLVSAGGHAIGTLCVTDGRSREWTDDDLATLTGLAAAVSMEIELHRRVAELEKAESWLTAQRHNLCLAMDAGNINIFEWDIPRDYVSWSENPEDLILNPVAFTGTFEDFMGLIFAEDCDRVRAALKSALHGHAEYRCEFRLLRGDASVRWREMRGRVEQDRIGKPLRMIGVDIDITERKLAEGKSFEAHQCLQALMDAVPVGVSYSEDASCQHVTGNRRAAG